MSCTYGTAHCLRIVVDCRLLESDHHVIRVIGLQVGPSGVHEYLSLLSHANVSEQILQTKWSVAYDSWRFKDFFCDSSTVGAYSDNSLAVDFSNRSLY